MKYGTLFLLVFSFLLTACDSDDDGSKTGALEITFKGLYDGTPLVMNRTYDFGLEEYKINVSQYYFSDLTMTNNATNVTLAPILKIVHTGDMDEQSAITGTTYRFEGIPEGTYDNLALGVGVSPELNAMEPSDFDQTHPLSAVGDYWDSWDSYIFCKLEGRLDTAAMNTFDLTFIYHSGGNELYQEVEMPVSIEIDGGGVTKMEMTVDHYDLLHRNGVPLDIKSRPTDHSAGDLLYPRYILENFENAINVTLQ